MDEAKEGVARAARKNGLDKLGIDRALFEGAVALVEVGRPEAAPVLVRTVGRMLADAADRRVASGAADSLVFHADLLTKFGHALLFIDTSTGARLVEMGARVAARARAV